MERTDLTTTAPHEEATAPLFTVFTATYERAHTLCRPFESLRAQTLRDFEWLIVDDGSRDGTRRLVEEWAQRAPFPIRYLYQENSGKHVAFNRAVRAARGKLFLPLDSDDGCAPEALERFRWHWESIPAEVRGQFTGVTALCVDQHGRLHGKRFPKDVLDSDSVEIRYRHALTGGKWGFHRTDVLRRYPFPEEPGLRYVIEDLVWSAIAQEYKTRFVNEPLHVYWVTQSEWTTITNTPNFARTAAGHATWHQVALNRDIRWMRQAPLAFLRHAANYARFSFWVGRGLRPQWRDLRPAARCLWIVALPAGMAVFLRDRFRERRRARARDGGAVRGTADVGRVGAARPKAVRVGQGSSSGDAQPGRSGTS
jgi:glycosyltransferase involved in cell wall biosynthesis